MMGEACSKYDGDDLESDTVNSEVKTDDSDENGDLQAHSPAHSFTLTRSLAGFITANFFDSVSPASSSRSPRKQARRQNAIGALQDLLPTAAVDAEGEVEAARSGDSEDSYQLPVLSRSTRRQRKHTSGRHLYAKPQLVTDADGNETPTWPEQWGITHGQIRKLLETLRQDPTWSSDANVYALTDEFIIPWTEGKGMSYALSQNKDDPKEVTVMISHAWGENAEEFLETVLRSTTEADSVFICALSLYQAEDGCGPCIQAQLGSKPADSPFRRVLMHIRKKGDEAGWRWRYRSQLALLPSVFGLLAVISFYLPTLLFGCAPSFEFCVQPVPEQLLEDMDHVNWKIVVEYLNGIDDWTWSRMGPTFPVYLSSAIFFGLLSAFSHVALKRAKTYAGRMIVVPNREVDLYSRLWCVYEIYVAVWLGVGVEVGRTLAHAGRVRAKMAVCSCEDDNDRIMQEIKAGTVSFDKIDQAVFVTTRGARWQAVQVSIGYGISIAIFVVAYLRIKGSNKNVSATVLGILLACVFIVAVLYAVFRRADGKPTLCAVANCAVGLVGTGFTLEVIQRMLDHRTLDGPIDHFLEHLARALLVGGVYVSVFLIAGLFAIACLPPRTLKTAGLPVLLAISLFWFGVLMFWELSTAHEPCIYASTVTNGSFVLGFILAPPYMCWSAAIGWGVHLRRQFSSGVRNTLSSIEVEKPDADDICRQRADSTWASCGGSMTSFNSVDNTSGVASVASLASTAHVGV